MFKRSIFGICLLTLFVISYSQNTRAASIYVDLNFNNGQVVDDPKMINAIDLNSLTLNSSGIVSGYANIASTDVLKPLSNRSDIGDAIVSVGREGLGYDGSICDNKSPKLLSLSYIYEFDTDANFKNKDGFLTFASFDKTKALPILEYSSGGYISNGAGQFGLAATGEGYPGGMLTPASDLSQRYVYAKYDLSGYSLGDLASLMIVQVNDVSGTKGSYMVSYAPIKMQLEYDDSDPSCAAKNQPPVTEHDDWSTPQETSITLDVMANDSDPNGDAIQITDWYFDSGDMDGSLSLVGNELVYTPSVGYTGDTVIIYVISDGEYKTKGTAKVNVYPYNILDGDNDGSLTSVEDGAPNNGDNNYDGILDSKQKDVTSVINPLTGRYQTLVISGSSCGDHQIMNYSVVAESANAVLDANRDYLLGLNKFELDCGDAGQDAILDIIYDKSYDTSKWDWIKFNTNTNIYSDASSGLGVNYRVDASGRTVAQITVRDGGPYDMDGSSNGHISDPSGPTEIISSPAVTELANSGDNFIKSLPVASFVMVASASIMVINFTKRIKNQNKYSIK